MSIIMKFIVKLFPEIMIKSETVRKRFAKILTSNIRNILRIVGSDSRHKVYKLLQFAGSERDIADPWYTGNFDVTYNDIYEGCTALLEYLLKNKTGV